MRYVGSWVSPSCRNRVPFIHYMAHLVPFFCLLLFSASAFSDVLDAALADVTTKSFSAVWASDEVILNASVELFTDAPGQNNVTDSYYQKVASKEVEQAHAKGLVKVEISGLSSGQTLHVRFVTETASGMHFYPTNSELLAVTTAKSTSVFNGNTLIVQDLLEYQPGDYASVSNAALVLLSIEGVTAYPVSAFVRYEQGDPYAAVDLGNLYDQAGETLVLPEDPVFIVEEYRGLDCAPESHTLRRYRRSPESVTNPVVAEVKAAKGCFGPNLFCDDDINVLDLQVLLNAYHSEPGDCGYNDDADIIQDDVVNVLDLQGLLNHYGEAAPFQ